MLPVGGIFLDPTCLWARVGLGRSLHSSCTCSARGVLKHPEKSTSLRVMLLQCPSMHQKGGPGSSVLKFVLQTTGLTCTMVCTECHPCRGVPSALRSLRRPLLPPLLLGCSINGVTCVTHQLWVSHAHSRPSDPLRTLRAAPKAVQPQRMSQSQHVGEVRNRPSETNPTSCVPGAHPMELCPDPQTSTH